MKTNLKIFVTIIAFATLISMACSVGTPAPTPTAVPTQTALPTYTPMPTYTPYPTPTQVPPTTVPPTRVPTATPKKLTTASGYDYSSYKGGGPTLRSCPNSSTPSIVSKVLCYEISGNGMGIVYLDSNGSMLALAIAITVGDNNSAYDAGVFAAQTAYMYGWNVNDIVGVLGEIQSPDTTYTYGSLKGQATESSDGTMVYVIFMPINSDFQG